MIRTITINGFKSIPEMTLELGRVNCFIGANGVGKSNILEAIGVLGAAANGIVDDEALLRRGVRPGLPRLYKSSFEASRTPAHIALSAVGGDGEEYRISLLNPLDNPGPAWTFKTEYLTDGTESIVSDGVRSKKNLNPTQSLAALMLVDLDKDNRAFKLMRRLQSYAIYSPNTQVLRGIGELQPREPVGLSGGNLAEAFGDLRRSVLNHNDALMDSVVELIDWVVDIETTNAAGSMLSPSVPRSKHFLKFTDRHMKKGRNTLTASDASEGALYVLFAAILCLSPKSPRLLAIDNLDQALNPRLATRLTGKLSEWLEQDKRKKRQILFTAHNPAVLDGLDLLNDEIRLFAVNRNSDGYTRINRIVPTTKLAALNKKYPLSRLWLMGHLGAVPNV